MADTSSDSKMNRLTRLSSFAVLAFSLIGAPPSNAEPGKPAPFRVEDVSAKQFDFEKLACAADLTEPEACRISREFMKAKAFSDWPAGAPVAFFGRAYEVKLDPIGHRTGKGRKGPFFMHLEHGRAQPAELHGVDPSTFTGYLAGWHVTNPDTATERAEVEALVSALSAGKATPKGNSVAEYVRATAPVGGLHPVVKTTGPSAFFSTTGAARGFFRSDGQRVLFLTWDKGDQDVIYATYGELWRVR